MLVIGLTGGIACGKSHVSRVLENMGASIIDGDKISRQLTEKDGEALPEIRKAFGSTVFHQDGTLDRAALADLVFSSENSEENRRRLNGIIHPMVIEKTRERLMVEREKGTEACVLDMPLLFEAHMEQLCDTCWCVVLSHEKQLQRLMERDNCTREEGEARIASQMSTEEKVKKSDVVIDTGGTLEYTSDVVISLYNKALRRKNESG